MHRNVLIPFTAALVAFTGATANASLIVNCEFTTNADGWSLIAHSPANWQGTGGGGLDSVAGWDGDLGGF